MTVPDQVYKQRCTSLVSQRYDIILTLKNKMIFAGVMKSAISIRFNSGACDRYKTVLEEAATIFFSALGHKTNTKPQMIVTVVVQWRLIWHDSTKTLETQEK